MKTINLKRVDSTLRNTYQEGHEDDAIAREAAIGFLLEDFNLDWEKAESLHDERIHKCGLRDTIRKCGEPSWIIESDKCLNLKGHDYFEEVA